MNDSISIAAVLLGIEAGVFLAAEHGRLRAVFRVLPAVFWVYLLPGLAATAGLIARSGPDRRTLPLFDFATGFVLPGALVVLLLSADMRAIVRLGRPALVMVLAGSAGVVLGGPAAVLLLGRWLPDGIWRGFGALSGSWIGGSANMIAVKEAVGTPEHVYSLMVIVDTVVAYAWMGLVIAAAALRPRYDRWSRCDGAVLADLARRAGPHAQDAPRPASLAGIAAVLAVAALGSAAAGRLAALLPEVPTVVSAAAWRIILASTLGVALSLTPGRRLERLGASKVGYVLLYFVLATIGARADFSRIAEVPLLLAAGGVWVAVHAAVLVAVGRLIRAPMFLTATASQANIGGPVSAPVVAEAYQHGLASVGLLLAVVGGVLGTYLGILCAQLCRWAAWLIGKA